MAAWDIRLWAYRSSGYGACLTRREIAGVRLRLVAVAGTIAPAAHPADRVAQRFQQVVRKDLGDEPAPAGDLNLVEDCFDVVADGVRGQREFGRDFLGWQRGIAA